MLAQAAEIDADKADDAVLALLRLTLHDERRAWKGFDWDALGWLRHKPQRLLKNALCRGDPP